MGVSCEVHLGVKMLRQLMRGGGIRGGKGGCWRLGDKGAAAWVWSRARGQRSGNEDGGRGGVAQQERVKSFHWWFDRVVNVRWSSKEGSVA